MPYLNSKNKNGLKTNKTNNLVDLVPWSETPRITFISILTCYHYSGFRCSDEIFY